MHVTVVCRAPMMSIRDGKRPMGFNLDGEQPSKVPRLAAPKPGGGTSVSSPPDRSTEPSPSLLLVSAPAAAIGSNADLLCHIGCMVDTGKPLFNLCVSVGPKVAKKIRHKYLHKNEAYVVKCLKRLEAIPKLQEYWENFIDNLALFDRCRDNIRA